MKFKLKTQGAQFTLERQFALGGGPALEFKIENYELSGNLVELIGGLQSLAKMLEPTDAEFDNLGKPPRDAEFSAEEHLKQKIREANPEFTEEEVNDHYMGIL